MKLLMENWRKYLNEEEIVIDWEAERQLIQEGKIGDFIQKHKSKIKDALQKLANEIAESTQLGKLLAKSFRQDLEISEKAFIKEQLKDLLGGTFLLGLFLLPGGAIATPVIIKLAKKFNIDLLPSSFKNAEKEENETPI